MLSSKMNLSSTVSILEIVQKEGMRNVKRAQEFYNLDAIISVGYRVNSAKEKFPKKLQMKKPNLNMTSLIKHRKSIQILTSR